MESNGNLKLWEAVEKTDPRRTKNFSGKGGFKGTAINPLYLIHRATEQWGPFGGRWGQRIIVEKIIEGAPLLGKDGMVVGHTLIHMVQSEVFYPTADGEGRVPSFGQTEFAGQRKSGEFYTDEEAPKKSLTDALTKALSWLGFSADIHMGRFDDVKYVEAALKDAEAADRDQELRTKMLPILKTAAAKGTAALQTAWEMLDIAAKKACKADVDGFKADAARVDKQREPAHA